MQDFCWPSNPSFDNPLVAIIGQNDSWNFNYQLKNGEKTEMHYLDNDKANFF